MYKTIRIYQKSGYGIVLVKYNDMFQVEMIEEGDLVHVNELLTLQEAEELYNSEVNILAGGENI